MRGAYSYGGARPSSETALHVALDVVRGIAMSCGTLSDGFYETIKPRLYRRIGRTLRLAYRILDIGCGRCELDRYLMNTYRQSVTGVDISDGSFPEHDSSATSRSPLKCVKADAARLDFLRNRALDAVVSMYALHEMADPHAVLREAHRILPPGGKILLVDFPRGSLAEELWNEKYYSGPDVGEMLRRAGFSDVRVKAVEKRQILWATGCREGIGEAAR